MYLMRSIRKVNIISLFFFTFILTLFGLVQAQSLTTLPNTFLWKVEKKGYPSSYLFGTLHLGKQYSELSSKVISALGRSEVLMMEIDKKEMEKSSVPIEGMMNLNKLLVKQIGKERFDKLARRMILTNMTKEQLNLFEPWAALLLLDNELTPEGYSLEYGSEMLLMKALSDKQQIQGLETFSDQIALFQRLPLKRICEYIDALLAVNHDAYTKKTKLFQLYTDNKAAAFYEMISDQDYVLEGIPEESHAYWWNWFNRKMIIERNHKWLLRLENKLKEAPTFIAVGAGHLYGKHGLVTLFRARGFTLTPVMP